MDQTILLEINRTWTAPWLDRVMATTSSWDFWWPILIVIGLLVLWRGGFHARSMLVCGGLAILMTDAITVRNSKQLVGRPRPPATMEGVRQVDLAKAKPRLLALAMPLQERISKTPKKIGRGGAFPSGHAANNFAIATVVFVFYRRWGWLCYLPAAVVAYSRVYIGAHWPSDVLISSLLGAGVTCLTLAAANFVWMRWGGKIVPTLHRNHPVLIAS